MKVPVSWLKELVDIQLPIEQLAQHITLAGLEVEGIRYVGLPLPAGPVEGHTGEGRAVQSNITGLAWDRERVVVGQILEVMPHPNADRLVLCRLEDGAREHTVLTGAPNLFPFKGKGPLERPLKVAFAKERLSPHLRRASSGWELMTLKRAKIRGVESYSMACSEKELGISEDHEGIILLDDDAVPGTPLADYMGDVVLDISLTPNLARCASILGMAREVAALTGAELRQPSYEVGWTGPALEGRVRLEIRQGAQPTLRAGLDRGGADRPQPLPGAAPPAPGRHAPHQQHRRCHQLRDAGGGAAAAFDLRCCCSEAAASRPP
jgi:phenylalanyl-tRNA synthetase beta chain